MATKESYQKHRIERLARMREYYQLNKERIKEYSRNYHANNKNDPVFQGKYKDRTRQNYIRNRERILSQSKNRWLKQRIALLEQVGGGRCAMCGFSDIRALQIDHIDGGGTSEVRNSKFRSPLRYAQHILLNPNKYQVLCANCNWIKRCENNEYKKQ